MIHEEGSRPGPTVQHRRWNHPWASNGSDRAGYGERGAALVEAAFLAPVFFLMLFAVFEFGFLVRNSLATTNASQEGARAASVHGAGPETDYLVLQTIKHGISAMGHESIEYVIIYKVDDLTAPAPPAGCHTASQNDVCNRYGSADLDLPLFRTDGTNTEHFRCHPNAKDRFFCPTDRKAGIADPPDLVGVFVQTRHTYMTGFLGDSRTLDETTVIRIEPEAEG